MNNNCCTDIWGVHNAEYSIDASKTWSAQKIRMHENSDYEKIKKILTACKINNKLTYMLLAVLTAHMQLSGICTSLTLLLTATYMFSTSSKNESH